jgi:hypothetical protein
MQRSQVICGDILAGGHKMVIVGLNCRDNCGGAAQAVAAAANVSITRFKRLAHASDVGRIVRIDVPESPMRRLSEILGLLLRRDRHLPIRTDDLRRALRQLVRYLGSPWHHQMHTHDVAMVAIGCGVGSFEGGFASLLRLLIEVRYPGVVYQPIDPTKRLPDEKLKALGLAGRADDPLPSWRCPRSDWSDRDEREVIGMGSLIPQRETA